MIVSDGINRVREYRDLMQCSLQEAKHHFALADRREFHQKIRDKIYNISVFSTNGDFKEILFDILTDLENTVEED
jgi:hypothetical protein